METASSLINDAFQEILVQANEQPTQSVDFQFAVRYLNRMMAALAANGINLGYTKVSSPNDAITVADGAIEGMIFNLAARLSPSFDIAVSPELAMNARNGMNSMRKIANRIQPTQMPCTLPIGSGNEGDYSYSDNHFYPCQPDEALTEQDGAILLETQTNE